MDADDLAIWKKAGQGVERDPVGWIIECRDEHEAVGDVEIRVTGRQPLTVEDDRARHGQLDDAQRLSILVASGVQPAEVFLERLVVWVVGARLDDGDHGFGIDKPRQVVDVAVRVVAVDPATQPDDVADTEVFGEDLLDRRTVEAGVASLDFARASIPRWPAEYPGR